MAKLIEKHIDNSKAKLCLWISIGLAFIVRLISLGYKIKQYVALEFFGSFFGAISLLPSIYLVIRYGVLGGACSLVMFQFFSLVGIVLYLLYYTPRKLVND